MPSGRLRIFALLALCVQLLAAGGVSRGDVVCQDLATGHSQRESVAEQRLCENCSDDAAVTDESGGGPSNGSPSIDTAGCVDTPVAGPDATPPHGPRVITSDLYGPAFAALPACVTPGLWPPAGLPHAGDAVALPDVVRRCVRTVVLVI